VGHKPGWEWIAKTAASFGLERYEPPEPPRGFDWDGVLVGHWVAFGPSSLGKDNRRVWRCVSACGVRSPFRADVLASGATKTCEACRPGAAPPPQSRVAPEGKVMDALLGFFAAENRYVNTKTNLKGNGLDDYDQYGADSLNQLFDRSGLGRDFGWKVTVRDAHRRGERDGGAPVRVRKWKDGARGVELAVQGKAYWYEVDLSTGRTDHAWGAIKRAIEITCETLRKESRSERGDGPAPKTASERHEMNGKPATAPPPPPSMAASEDRLVRLQNGIARAIEVSRDAKAGAELRAEIVARVEAARAEASPLKSKYEAAEVVARRASDAAADAQEKANRLAAELRDATAERDRLSAELAAAKTAALAAADAYAPARERLAAAEAELADAEQQEKERQKTMEKAGDVAVLLAALEKLGLA